MLSASLLYVACIIILAFVSSTTNSQEFFSTGGRYGKRMPQDETFESGRQAELNALERRSLSSITPENSPIIEMSGRNDRFFMGSRYGKRASLELLKSDSRFRDRSGAQLTCFYIGFEDFYRCSLGKEKRLHDAEPVPREET